MSNFLGDLKNFFGPGTERLNDTVASDNEVLCTVPAQVYSISFVVSAASAGTDWELRDGTATGDASFTTRFRFPVDFTGTHLFDYNLHPLRFDKGIVVSYSASGGNFMSHVMWGVKGGPTPAT